MLFYIKKINYKYIVLQFIFLIPGIGEVKSLH